MRFAPGLRVVEDEDAVGAVVVRDGVLPAGEPAGRRSFDEAARAGVHAEAVMGAEVTLPTWTMVTERKAAFLSNPWVSTRAALARSRAYR
jgi:hypothetical protein